MPEPLHRIPFHFHALAHALAGEFRHPLWSIIPARASASLSTIGGHASAEERAFHFQDFVCFKSAHTFVSGKRRKDDTYVTHASTVVKGLNILGRVTVDRIVARLTSVHDPRQPEGHITAEDSRFEGLKIDNQEFKVTLRHKLLVECKTFDDLAKRVAGDKKSGLDENRKVALCSLVEKIEPKVPGVDVEQHVIAVKNFGKIFLAEVLAAPGERTLTMLRLELGSPHVAELTAAEAATNGKPWPPTG